MLQVQDLGDSGDVDALRDELVDALQTLRLYERRGLLTPARTDGGTRRYSDDDLQRLQRINELVAQGINIAGIAQILHLEHRTSELESDNSDLKSENARLRSEEPTIRGGTKKR